MDFYSELSRYYDEVFPAEAADFAFIHHQLDGKTTVLDIGCGTGNKTVLLGAADKRIVGIDSDPAMIARARAEHSLPFVHYHVLDMQAIGSTFCERVFDGAVCLGNTLVHLTGPQAIREFLGAVGGTLVDDGVFIIQILHYDRIIAEKIESLPLIDTPNVQFLRSYVRCGQAFHFVTELRLKATQQSLHNDIVLYPLLRAELTAMLQAAGFDRVELYGGFHGEPLTEASFVLVAVCRNGAQSG